MTKHIEIYTDGACRGNPGPGGWGAVLFYGDHEKTLKGSDPNTTNNRMELLGAISALDSLSERCTIRIHTDSTYVMKGISEWLPNWKRRNWRTASRQPVKNADLWKRLDALNQGQDVEWLWVKGHSGNPGNEQADSLANEAIDGLLEL
jgi:ribonuclease HI